MPFDGVFLRQLEWMANNHICWVNDSYGLGRRTAMYRAVAMCDAELEAFEVSGRWERLTSAGVLGPGQGNSFEWGW